MSADSESVPQDSTPVTWKDIGRLCRNDDQGFEAAFENFKERLRPDTCPTNSDIRAYLDSPQADHRSRSPNGGRMFDSHALSAKDRVACYLIQQVIDKTTPPNALSIFNGTIDEERPLIDLLVEGELWYSTALMLSSGVRPDAPETIFDEASKNPSDILVDHRFKSPSKLGVIELLDLGIMCAEMRGAMFSNHHAYRIADLLYHEIGWSENSNSEYPKPGWYKMFSNNGLIVQAIITHCGTKPMLETFQDQFYPSFVAPGDPYLTHRTPMYWSSRAKKTGHASPSGPIESMVIVFPTLILTTLERHREKRKKYKTIRDRISTRVGGYIPLLCPVHLERTLDEVYFPGLPEDELSVRNRDQIVSREFKDELDMETPIVIVPQLWLWRFDGLVISAHSLPSDSWASEPSWERPDDRNHTLDMIKNMGEYIENFGKKGITLDSHNVSGERLEPSTPNKREVLPNNRRYRTGSDISTNRPKSSASDEQDTEVLPILDLFERHVTRVLSRAKDYTDNSNPNQIAYETEARLHHDLSDARSELAMILYVLKDQKKILDDFRADMTKELDPYEIGLDRNRLRAGEEAVRLIDGLLDTLKGYEERVFKIDGDAERIEKTVQDLLNLKRTYASVRDSHASVLLGVAAGAFAIITIFFAPLAFLTALFALKIQGFEKLMNANEPEKPAPSGQIVPASTEAATADPVYNGPKMVGIFVGSVFLTFLITAVLMIWGMRKLGFTLDDLRLEGAKSSNDVSKEDRKRTKGITSTKKNPDSGQKSTMGVVSKLNPFKSGKKTTAGADSKDNPSKSGKKSTARANPENQNPTPDKKGKFSFSALTRSNKNKGDSIAPGEPRKRQPRPNDEEQQLPQTTDGGEEKK